MNPSVSVVVPVGRVDAELDEQLGALDAQCHDGPLEIVLALNAPGAEAHSALQAMTRNRRWPTRVARAADRPGAAHARNVGAAEAEGELLLFCDGDDRVAPGWVSALVAAMAPGRAVGGCLDERELAVPGQTDWRPPATPGDLPAFLGHPYLVSANCAVRREDVLRVGGFDETLTRCEDLAFSYALVDAGIELVYVPDAVVHYRHRAGLMPMLRQHFAYGRGMSEVVARGLLPGGSSPARLRPNGQKVERWNSAQVMRKAALGAGRLVGAVQEATTRSG